MNKDPLIHFNASENMHAKIACGVDWKSAHELESTKDVIKVTCKRCLKFTRLRVL